jgi:hypothetical protein
MSDYDIQRIDDNIKTINTKLDEIEKRLTDIELDVEIDREKNTTAMKERMQLSLKMKKVYQKLSHVSEKFNEIKDRHDIEDKSKKKAIKKKNHWKKIRIAIGVTIFSGIVLLLVPHAWTLLVKLLGFILPYLS